MDERLEFAEKVGSALRAMLAEPPTDLIWLAPNDVRVDVDDDSVCVSLPVWAPLGAFHHVRNVINRYAGLLFDDMFVGEPTVGSDRMSLVAEFRTPAPAMCV